VIPATAFPNASVTLATVFTVEVVFAVAAGAKARLYAGPAVPFT